MRQGERVLVHGTWAAWPPASRASPASWAPPGSSVPSRAGNLGAAQQTKLPYDEIIDSAELPARLADKRFDVIIDPVGGSVRTASIELLAPFGRLLLAGNASGDWNHQINSSRIWQGNLAILGFAAGSFLPSHKDLARPAATAAIRAAAAGLAKANVETLPLSSAAEAHERLGHHSVDGRLVLHP